MVAVSPPSNSSPAPTNKQQYSHWMLASFAALVILLSSSQFLSSDNQRLSDPIMTKDDDVNVSKIPRIRFEEISAGDGEEKDSVLRYAAFYEANKGSSSKGKPVTMAEWITLMKENKHDVARTMTKLLQQAPFKAFRFETPGVSVETVHDKPFEFVLVKDSYLQNFAAQEDPEPFSEHLQCTDNHMQTPGPAACSFLNLGGDAILVAPRNWESSKSSNTNYHGHLANFVRGASTEQIIGTWKIVATTLETQLLGKSPQRPPTKPLWFSTAGDGVAWLHFRLDSRPKYYHYRPYREF